MRSLLLLFASLAPIYGGCQSRVSLLEGMRGHERPVLIFAGTDDKRVATEYIELATHAAELGDRQMRIVLVTQSPTPSKEGHPLEIVTATPADTIALRVQFQIPPGSFNVILVGKDGGEKFRSSQPVSFKRLRLLVDAMPMRQQEMQGH